MKTITKKYTVYNYNELTDKAKEKVKREYLNDPIINDIFHEDCMMTIEDLFPKSDLKVQYSLSYCQGDGFNIYGMLNILDFLNLMKHPENLPITLFDNIKNQMLSTTELSIISEYYNNYCGNVRIPYNNNYCYSMANMIDFAEEWESILEDENIKYDKQLIDKFELFMKHFFSELNKMLEDEGYDFLYEISDEDMEEECIANEWTFLEDGTLFC